jgi:hypothetical protein
MTASPLRQEEDADVAVVEVAVVVDEVVRVASVPGAAEVAATAGESVADLASGEVNVVAGSGVEIAVEIAVGTAAATVVEAASVEATVVGIEAVSAEVTAVGIEAVSAEVTAVGIEAVSVEATAVGIAEVSSARSFLLLIFVLKHAFRIPWPFGRGVEKLRLGPGSWTRCPSRGDCSMTEEVWAMLGV